MRQHLTIAREGVAFLFACVAAAAALAQDYPARPVKIVIPWPAGQATDIVARVIGERMGAALGQPFVMDNRAGAAGTIGTEFAAKSAADGYTLLAGSSGPISISPQVQKVPYEPQRDFEPLCLLASSTYVLVTHPSVPANTFGEFIALLRANPGKYAFASGGTASTSHLIVEMFNSQMGVKATHVPYKGSPPAITDLIGGHVTYTLETTAAVLAHVKGGRLKALAVTSGAHSAMLPDLPTVAEASGNAGFEVTAWIGLLAPAGIPNDARIRLSAECRKQLDAPGVHERLAVLGLDPPNRADDMSVFLKKQAERFAAIVRQSGIRAD